MELLYPTELLHPTELLNYGDFNRLQNCAWTYRRDLIGHQESNYRDGDRETEQVFWVSYFLRD